MENKFVLAACRFIFLYSAAIKYATLFRFFVFWGFWFGLGYLGPFFPFEALVSHLTIDFGFWM